MDKCRAHRKLSTRRHKHTELGILDGGKKCHPLKTINRDDQPAGSLSHSLNQEHARHQREARKVALEDRASCWNCCLGADCAVRETEIGNPVNQLEVLKTHVIRALGSLSSDKFVDAGAQVLKHEVLIRGCLAVIYFLCPLLERKLDTECLVDSKCDIEEIKAVYAEIIDGMAFRLDGIARDIARLGDDIGDGVERRRHR